MKSKVSLLIVVLGIALMIMPSCKKVADEVVGTWDIMTFDTKPEGTMQITFDGDSTAIRIMNSERGMLVDSCSYEIIKKNCKQKLVFRNSKMLPGYDKLDGIYRIDKIKNDIIIATRIEYEDTIKGGEYYRLELKKKN